MTQDIAIRRRVYGRRRGKKLRQGQRRLVDTLLPGLTISADELPQSSDPKGFFDKPVDQVWLEVGFGKGEHLLWQAMRHPDVGFIGCEPFIDGVATLLAGIETEGLDNIRIFRDDARLLLEHIEDRSLDRAFILFPDPWPKARHHKRRFIQDDTMALLARRMTPGGELRIATDHADYGHWILEHMARRPEFEWLVTRPADCRRRTEDWPPTRYEQKAERQGRHSLYLRYRNRGLD